MPCKRDVLTIDKEFGLGCVRKFLMRYTCEWVWCFLWENKL